MPAPSPQFVTLLSSAVRTANATGDPIDLCSLTSGPLSSPPSLLVTSNVTAASGTTPTHVVVIEDSLDGGVTWNVVGTFASQTAVNRAVIQVSPSGVAQSAGFRWPFNPKRVRARVTIGGTLPSFTSSVTCVMV